MKKVILGLGAILLCLIGAWGFSLFSTSTMIETQTVTLQSSDAPLVRSLEPPKTLKEDDLSLPGRRCAVWGPFSQKFLPKAQASLKRYHLQDRVVLRDRFIPDSFVIYVGPLNTPTAARALAKQFQQQGYKHATALTKGELSYGVSLGQFIEKEKAEQYLKSIKNPPIQGMTIRTKLGGPSNNVDLMFVELSTEEYDQLVKLSQSWSKTSISECY